MLQVTTAESALRLAAHLVHELGRPLGDPMAAEWIVVTTSGVSRWLRLELARQLGNSGDDRSDGVAANIDLFFPGQLVRRILHPEGDRSIDPWDLDRMAWVILDVLASPTSAANLDLGPLSRLAPGVTQWGRARRLADLFDRYLTHRPEMIRDWAAHPDLDGVGQRLPDRSMWQPHLWRLVRERIGVPSPPELLPERLDALRSGACPESVPERISLFGLTTIPGGAPFLDLVDALSTQRHVHLLVHETSPALTHRTQIAAGSQIEPVRYRSDDPSTQSARHPLLRSWARSSREAVLLLHPWLPATSPDSDVLDHPVMVASGSTLLTRLQHDLRFDLEPDGTFVPRTDDQSIRIHSCHGNTRQVEVLRDQILHLLADDPTLTEEDIVVFCPALDTFAPLVEAVFGPSAGSMVPGVPPPPGPPAINYRITDRSLGSAYSLLGAMGSLVELLASRFSDAAVIDFANLLAVRERFQFNDVDLNTMADWVEQANTSWGLDGSHRTRWGIPAEYHAGSWGRAIDRLLLGITTTDSPHSLAPGDLLPLAAEGSDIELAGRLAELLQRLRQLAQEVHQPRPIREWIELLQSAARDLLAVDPDLAWQEVRLNNVLEAIAESAHLDGISCPVVLPFDDVRHLLGRHLGGPAGRSDFFRGGVTISSLTPLRGLPYRAVLLLGMDESAFPSGAPDGDDLTTAKPHIGDRDRRADTRQMLLDTILAAGEHLILLRNGRSVVTNQTVPAAVVIAELADTIARTVPADRRPDVRERLTLVHPRQAFDENNYLAEETPAPGIGRRGPWSFDPLGRAGAEARIASRRTPPLLAGLIGDPELSVIDLADLRDFFRHPPRYFLQRVLGISLPTVPTRTGGRLVAATPGSSGLPRPSEGRSLLLELESLEGWKVNDRLLDHLRRGDTLDSFLRRDVAGDLLPPGRLASAVLKAAEKKVEPLIEALHLLGSLGTQSENHAIDLTLSDGTRVVGVVLNDKGDRPGPIHVSVSKKQENHRIVPWIEAMALIAAEPDVPWRSVLVHPAASKAGSMVATIDIDSDEGNRGSRAMGALEVAVDLFRRGCREPIPIFPKLSWALFHGKGAGSAWNSDDYTKGEGDDRWIQVAFDHASLDEITNLAIQSHDPDGPGHDRATRYAHHFWTTLQETGASTKVKAP